MFQITINAGNDEDYSGTILDANGNAIAITAGSDVLLKLFRGNPGTPDLDLSGTALAGGSVTSFTSGSGAGQGAWNVKFFGADTVLLNPQTYQAWVMLVDTGDGNREKLVEEGIVCVLGTVSGKTT